MTKIRNHIQYLSVSTLLRIKHCIKAGYSIDELAEYFNITRESARKQFVKYNGEKYREPRLGRKNQPYFEGDFPEIPEYKLEDLTGEEAEIARESSNIKKPKNMGRMKELFMEMQEYYNGEIPEDATLHEFLRIKEAQSGEWKEYEDGIKKSEKSKDSGYDDKRNDSISKK